MLQLPCSSKSTSKAINQGTDRINDLRHLVESILELADEEKIEPSHLPTLSFFGPT
jgi:hypothetical protein